MNFTIDKWCNMKRTVIEIGQGQLKDLWKIREETTKKIEGVLECARACLRERDEPVLYDIGRAIGLLWSYEDAELLFRRGLFEGIIVGQGLAAQSDYIMDGWLSSAHTWGNDFYSLEEWYLSKKVEDLVVDFEEFAQRSIETVLGTQNKTNLALSRFPTYLEKWKMYNELFGEK